MHTVYYTDIVNAYWHANATESPTHRPSLFEASIGTIVLCVWLAYISVAFSRRMIVPSGNATPCERPAIVLHCAALRLSYNRNRTDILA